MRVAIYQIIMIAEMIKVEFKITDPNGHGAHIEKMLNSFDDYEQFKEEVRMSVVSLDSIITHKLKQLTNGKTTDTADRSAKA